MNVSKDQVASIVDNLSSGNVADAKTSLNTAVSDAFETAVNEQLKKKNS